MCAFAHVCTGCACVRLCEYIQKRTGSNMLLCLPVFVLCMWMRCNLLFVHQWQTVLKTHTHAERELEREREGDVRLPLGILTIKSKQFFKHPSNNNNRYGMNGTVVVAVHAQQTDNTIADACETAYPYFRSLWQWFCRTELCNWNIFNSDIITVTTDDLFSTLAEFQVTGICLKSKLNSLSDIIYVLLVK